MSRRATLWTALALVALGCLVLNWLPNSAAIPPAVPEQDDARSAEVAVSPSSISRLATRTEREPYGDGRPFVRARSTGSGAVLADTQVALIESESARGIALPLSPIGNPTDLGVVLPRESAGKSCIVVAPGCAPGTVRPAVGEVHEVPLEAGHRLRVVLVDAAGAPQRGRMVFLARSPLFHTAGYSTAMIGNPLSPLPLWVAISDDEGVAVLDHLPAGHYTVTTHGDGNCPDRVPPVVTVPGGDLRIVLHELYGIVALPPSESPVLWKKITTEGPRRIRNRCASVASAAAERQLEAAFPGAIVHAHLPENPYAVTNVRIAAVLEDGTECALTWGLQPISRISEPVFLEVVGRAGIGSIQVDLVHREQQLRGVPLLVTATDRKYSFDAVSGSRERVPAGRYKVSPTFATPWLEAPFRDVEINVAPGADVSIPLSVDWPLVAVRVEPTFSHGSFDAAIHVGATLERLGSNVTIASWTPERGPIRFWVPPGSLPLWASADGYARVEKTIEVGPDAEPELVVELQLSPRTRWFPSCPPR